MNHEKTHQTNPMVPWGPQDAMWQWNISANKYKSYNNKQYQQKTTYVPTLKLPQSNIKEKLQIYQQ